MIEPRDRTYGARLDWNARLASRRAEIASELQADFIAAAFSAGADTLVQTPGSSVPQRSIGFLLSCYVHEGELHDLLRDAAQGKDVSIEAALLLSMLANRFAEAQADAAMELEDGEPDDEATL
jgi:hypothetical protein